jgi:hypothetical protein
MIVPPAYRIVPEPGARGQSVADVRRFCLQQPCFRHDIVVLGILDAGMSEADTRAAIRVYFATIDDGSDWSRPLPRDD